MSTKVVKSLRLDASCRPYGHATIDELFEELVVDAKWTMGLIEFAMGLYAEHNTDKIDASAVFAFVNSLRQPMFNVVDALGPIMYELKQREEDRTVSDE